LPLDHDLTLGRWGPRVGPFALGAMTFGEDPDGADCSVERTVEGEFAPLALGLGMALLTWSPLKSGFLSGKYRRGKQVADSAAPADYVGGPDPRHRQRR
jgi:aryl-alcohol dehydrogenase-like predicted oxidoreductase